MRRARVEVRVVPGARRRLDRDPGGRDLRAHRRERLAARARCSSASRGSCGPSAGTIRTRGQDLGAARARRRLPPRAVRAATTSTSTARSSGSRKKQLNAPLRRHRRLRRARALHRHAGEELLVGHVRAARLLGRDQRRPGHPPGRRGARGRRRGVPARAARRSSRSSSTAARPSSIVSPRARLGAQPLRRGRAARARQAASRSAPRARSIDGYLADVHVDRVARTASTASPLGLAARARSSRSSCSVADGAAGTDLHTGDPLTIRLHYALSEPIPQPVFGVGDPDDRGLHRHRAEHPPGRRGAGRAERHRARRPARSTG